MVVMAVFDKNGLSILLSTLVVPCGVVPGVF